jgi:hypothetical protein
VTLEQLHQCLTEELDIALDAPDRPATFVPERASRDRERWTALATYGHPMLQPALQKIAAGREPTPALVLAEIERRAVAYRADRTPPARVRSVSDLLDVGEPVAAGEARDRAQRDLHEDIEASRAHAETLARAQKTKWQADVRRRLRQLVVRAVNAEMSLQLRRDEEAPDMNLVWLELASDTYTGWAYADTFRQHLGMQVSELLPSGPPGADSRGDRELQRVRSDTALELLALIEEWKAVAASA